jgi:exopolyphosphatase/guanosine-5'-triphosphate,3'-diphosphate pyrophosphatase
MFIKRKKKLVLSLIISCTLFSIFYFIYNRSCIELRYAFDFGSGAIKSQSAEVNSCTGKIIEIKEELVENNKFEQCIHTNENDEKFIIDDCVKKSIKAVENIERKFGIDCSVDKCRGIATEWARKVVNSHEILNSMAERHIHIKVLTQKEEGEAGFRAALAHPDVQATPKNDLVVWEIGGGSFQISTLDDQGEIHVYNGKFGAESFDKAARALVNADGNNNSSYLDGEDLEKVLNFAESIGAEVLSDPVISKKLQNPNVKVFTMGRPMYKALHQQMSLPVNTNAATLLDVVNKFSGATYQDVQTKLFPEIPDFFLKTAQSCAIVVYGIMKGAQINEINIISARLNDYILTHPEYWQDK